MLLPETLGFKMQIALLAFLCFISCKAVTGSPRVSFSKTAKPNTWKSQVLIITGEKDYNVCGGSIISSEWVLTAAHCVRTSIGKKEVNPLSYKLYVGAYDRNNSSGTEVLRNIAQIVNFPKYETQNHSHDIALIKMDEPIDFNQYENIRPICLATEEINLDNKKCFLTGFGRPANYYFDTKFPQFLQQLQMKPFNQTECARIHHEHYENEDSKEEVTELQFCMSSKESHLWYNSYGGGCDGDSGSPLQCWYNKQWNQVGVTWSGTDCQLQPTVFQKVYAEEYLNFIKSYTEINPKPYCKQNRMQKIKLNNVYVKA